MLQADEYKAVKRQKTKQVQSTSLFNTHFLMFTMKQFLPRDAMQERPMSSCGVCLSVCMSVRPSATFVDSVVTNKHYLQQFFTVG